MYEVGSKEQGWVDPSGRREAGSLSVTISLRESPPQPLPQVHGKSQGLLMSVVVYWLCTYSLL